MSTERWRYELRCPKCGRTGVEDESQADGWSFMRAVERGQKFNFVDVSAGFKIKSETPQGYAMVVCVDCDVEPERKEVPR